MDHWPPSSRAYNNRRDEHSRDEHLIVRPKQESSPQESGSLDGTLWSCPQGPVPPRNSHAAEVVEPSSSVLPKEEIQVSYQASCATDNAYGNLRGVKSKAGIKRARPYTQTKLDGSCIKKRR
jgi:hypothetical protein